MDYGSKEALHIGAHEGNVPVDDGTETFEDKGLKLWADLGISIGKNLEQNTQTLNQINKNLQSNTPVGYSYSASGVFPASGVLTLTLGTPDLGTNWEVAMMAVGGTDVNIAVAGIAGVYVTGIGIGNATGGLSNLQDYANGLPNVGFYSNKQLMVNDREYLIVQIFNGTPGTIYIASAQVTVYDNRAAGGVVVEAE